MTRTIYIVFSNDFFKSCSKEYMFLCNYNIVKVGDIIRDPRYSTDMKVINITSDTRRIQYGITLKDIYITHINGNLIIQPSGLVNGTIIGSDFDIDKQRNNNMEKRNIKVTLEQAIEWYNSGNETLRTLALTVFTEEELTLNMHYIYNKVIRESICINIPSMEASKNIALAELSLVAKYFNGDWKPDWSNSEEAKYYLYFYGKHYIDIDYSCQYNHCLVYFKSIELAQQAIEILGEETIKLALSTDW